MKMNKSLLKERLGKTRKSLKFIKSDKPLIADSGSSANTGVANASITPTAVNPYFINLRLFLVLPSLSFSNDLFIFMFFLLTKLYDFYIFYIIADL